MYAPAVKLIGNLTTAAVLLTAGYRVMDGALEVGVLLRSCCTCVGSSSRCRTAMFYNSYKSAAAALEKLSGVLEERRTVPEPVDPVRSSRPSGAAALTFDEVPSPTARLGGLPRPRPDIPAGQTVALVGATGAGKSTHGPTARAVLRPARGRGAAGRHRPAPAADEDLRRAS